MSTDDYLKKAGDVFNKLGHRLRTTVGVGVGAVELALDTRDLSPGDTLRGAVTLRLPEPVEAKRLVLAIRATQKMVSYGKDPHGGRSVQQNRVVVYRQNRELDGERTYRDGERFEGQLVIPADVLEREPEIEGTLGAVARAVSSLTQPRRLPLEWQVMALLEIPWKRNLKKVHEITVSPR
jgi:hypothetical protein